VNVFIGTGYVKPVYRGKIKKIIQQTIAQRLAYFQAVLKGITVNRGKEIKKNWGVKTTAGMIDYRGSRYTLLFSSVCLAPLIDNIDERCCISTFCALYVCYTYVEL